MCMCSSMRENNARSVEWIGCRQVDEEEGGMKIKSNYLNAFHVANLSLSISLLCVCQVFFSPFFFFCFIFLSFHLLGFTSRCATTSHFSWPLLPFAKSRGYVLYICIYICMWRLKEDYNLFSVSCSLLFEFAYQTENLPFLLINCL